MKNFLSKIQIQVNEKVYLKDPESSELGRKIITESIEMIDDLGFELFTLRKLGGEIKSTEASIYRYFESKHKLLLYLISWYWNWTEYRLVFGLANIDSPQDRLKKAITILTEEVKEDSSFSHIDKIKLDRIVISESIKAYLTKEVDKENQEGAFAGQKQIVARLSDIILEINPSYKYSHMLASTTIEGAHLQRYFVEHLPRLTDVIKGENAIISFYTDMVFKAIQK